MSGATLFAEFYLQEVGRSWMSADSRLLKSLALPECKSCANYVATADSLATNGQHYASSPARVSAGIYLPESTSDLAAVQVPARQLAADIVTREGKVVRTTKTAGLLSEFTLRWSGERGWLVVSIIPVVVS
jgi:hypothetical protein